MVRNSALMAGSWRCSMFLAPILAAEPVFHAPPRSAGSGRGADVRGPSTIRRILSGPHSETEQRNIVQFRAVRALFRDEIRLISPRAGRRRASGSTSHRDPPKLPPGTRPTSGEISERLSRCWRAGGIVRAFFEYFVAASAALARSISRAKPVRKFVRSPMELAGGCGLETPQNSRRKGL